VKSTEEATAKGFSDILAIRKINVTPKAGWFRAISFGVFLRDSPYTRA